MTLSVILFILLGIVGCRQNRINDDLITINVTKSYPEKELTLQDFMDIEYIALETNDEFITQGVVLAISNKLILVKNWANDGNIFVFDRKTGKGLRNINRMGRGPEEYSNINGIAIDEGNNELFVNCASTKKVFVYDLLGNFKRSFNHTKGTQYIDIFNYDNDNLIRYDMSVYYKDGENKGGQSNFAIISKKDGSITRNISIPFDIIKAPLVNEGDKTVVTSVRSLIPYQNNWLLVETSSDTVYNYLSKENKLVPFLVKDPTTNPEIFLTMGTITDRFYFIETIKKIFDFSTGRGFPVTDLIYDKQEDAIFKPVVVNGDFVKRKAVDMTSHPVNNEIATFQKLEAYQLVEAYHNEELKGELKEVAAKLEEGSNPVIMVMKYRK